MKLIIDISEHIYASSKVLADLDGSPILKAIKESVPLDNLRAEIDEIPLSEPMVSADGLYCYGTKSISMGHFREKILEIIDKYREGSE